MGVCPSVCLDVSLYVCQYIHTSVITFICPLVCLFACYYINTYLKAIVTLPSCQFSQILPLMRYFGLQGLGTLVYSDMPNDVFVVIISGNIICPSFKDFMFS